MSDEPRSERAQDAAGQDKEKRGHVFTEEVKVSGEAVVSKVKELIREGNIRRIIVKNESGKTLFEIPLTIGVVGALIAPQLAALGAVGALIANLSITVEREAEVETLTPDSKEETA